MGEEFRIPYLRSPLVSLSKASYDLSRCKAEMTTNGRRLYRLLFASQRSYKSITRDSVLQLRENRTIGEKREVVYRSMFISGGV